MIRAEAISRRLGGRDIPDAVTTAVRPGQVTAIVGPNGAGKSTLLKCLTGALRPDRGAVTLDGRPLDAFSLGALARRRAVLSQSTPVTFPFKVTEIVAMGRNPHAAGPAKRSGDAHAADVAIIRRALDDVDAWHLHDRVFPTLSGGERQRVQLARVLAQVWRQDDAYLFLDEPTSELDLKHQHQLLALVRTLALDEGAGVCLVMHDLNLVRRYADRAVLMQDGRAVADGPVAETVTPDNVATVFEVSPDLVFGDRLTV